MKTLFTICALSTLFVIDSSAQSLSAGLRTGTSCWMQRAQDKCGTLEAVPGRHRSWDKEMFVRWEGKGRWAFEGGVSHARLTHSEMTTITSNENSTTFVTSDYNMTRRANQFDVSFSAQYDITCRHMRSCPLMKRFRSYAGVSVIPSVTQIRETYENSANKIEFEERKFQAWTGLSHTVVFAATPQLSISSVVEGRVAPVELFDGSSRDSYRPAARMGVRIGAAYRFGSRCPTAASTKK